MALVGLRRAPGGNDENRNNGEDRKPFDKIGFDLFWDCKVCGQRFRGKYRRQLVRNHERTIHTNHLRKGDAGIKRNQDQTELQDGCSTIKRIKIEEPTRLSREVAGSKQFLDQCPTFIRRLSDGVRSSSERRHLRQLRAGITTPFPEYPIQYFYRDSSIRDAAWQSFSTAFGTNLVWSSTAAATNSQNDSFDILEILANQVIDQPVVNIVHPVNYDVISPPRLLPPPATIFGYDALPGGVDDINLEFAYGDHMDEGNGFKDDVWLQSIVKQKPNYNYD